MPMVLPEDIKTPTAFSKTFVSANKTSSNEASNEDRLSQSSLLGGENKSKGVRYRLDAFYSTPKFVHSLTTLCDGVLEEPAESQKEFLLQGLRRINCMIPSAVYLPFVS